MTTINNSFNRKLSLTSFQFLFLEIINFNLNKVDGIGELENNLNLLGYRVGKSILNLLIFKLESGSKQSKLPLNLLQILQFIHTNVKFIHVFYSFIVFI